MGKASNAKRPHHTGRLPSGCRIFNQPLTVLVGGEGGGVGGGGGVWLGYIVCLPSTGWWYLSYIPTEQVVVTGINFDTSMRLTEFIRHSVFYLYFYSLFFDVTSNVSFLRGSNTEESDVTAGPLPDVTYSRAPRPNQLPRLHS